MIGIGYKGGETVGKGTYWNFRNGERVDVEGTEMLPGGSTARYVKAPAAGLLVLGPALGLLYAMFLPFIGIAMLVKLVAEKAAGGAMEALQGSASFGWRPSESYLSGKKRGKKGRKEEDTEGAGEEKRSD